MTSEIKVGDYAHTIKGAEFWGEVIALDNDENSPGCTIMAIEPGFRRTKHVYPLAQLALGIPDYQSCSNAHTQAEVEQLRAEAERLREALKPFAEASDIIPVADLHSNIRARLLFGSSAVGVVELPTVGDFRAARRALEPENG